MATWDAHLLSCLFFTVHGLWWIILSVWYHLQLQQDSNRIAKKCISCTRSSHTVQYKVIRTGCLKSWLPVPLFPSIPLESVLKIFAGSIGIFGEAFLRIVMESPKRLEWYAFKIFDSNGDFVRVDKFQHITMYCGFVLSGVVDLLILFVRLPHATSPLFFSLAFLCQGVLFWFHTGHGVLNGTYHKLQIMIIISCVVFSYLRTHHSKTFLVNIGLGCSILLQGTWFFQASFLVFHDGENVWKLHMTEFHSEKLQHMVPMYLGTVFTWHLMAVATTALIIWSIMYCAVNGNCRIRKWKSQEDTLPNECTEKLIVNGSLSDENDGVKEVKLDEEP